MKKILKKIYLLIPFKQYFFSFLKIFWTPPHRVYKHLHFTGVMKVKTTNDSFFRMYNYGYEIENDIFWHGLNNGWEKKSMKLWMRLCTDANVIMDIGANTGIYALTAKTINPSATVFAFEPLHRIFMKLKKNNDLNHYNIKCIEKALSEKEGEQVIYENNEPHVDAATLNQYTAVTYGQGRLNKETIIKTTTIDKMIESENLQRVDLLKIDVETYEPQVMEGFKKYLPAFKPSILIEVLTDEVGRRLHEVFGPLGYIYFNIDDNNDSIRRVEVLGKSDHFNCLICTTETASKLGLPGGRLN